jgi:phage-related protein
MRLKEIRKKNWTVCAIADANGNCELEAWLSSNRANSSYKSSVVGMLALFEHVADYGIQHLSDKLSHQIDANNKLYEFIKGKLRVIYFVDAGKIIVCTHGFNKTQSQKLPKAESEKAIRLKGMYELQKKSNS